MRTFQFQLQIVALGKAHTRTAPSLSSLPKVALETVPTFVWLNTECGRMRAYLYSRTALPRRRILTTYMMARNDQIRQYPITAVLFLGFFTSQQRASVSQGRICSDNGTCCHTAIETADQTGYLTQSQYTDTGPASPSPDPMTPGAWQRSHRRNRFFKSRV